MKLVIITGSSSGLGKAIAKGFLAKGNVVYGIARSETIEHENYHHIKLDLSDPTQYKSVLMPSFDGYDEVVWINNAGSIEPVAKVGNLDTVLTEKAYQTNLLAPIFFINHLAGISANYSGRIYVLNISSGAARYPVEGWGIYCSSKAALDAFAAVVDKEMKRNDANFFIRNIYPGIIDTPMQERIRASDSQDFPEVERFKNYKNQQKLTSPEEVASTIILNFNSFFIGEEIAFALK